MKKIVWVLMAFGFCSFGQTKPDALQNDEAFRLATKKWFSAWELLSKEIYGIEKVKPVDFVFFDDMYVYSTSTVTVEKGEVVTGNNLMNLNFVWKRTAHNGSMTLPDNSVVEVNLMSYASEIPNQNKSFFVMPLPSFWEKAGVKSNELGLDNLTIGVFLHEFSHSQQMQSFGKQIGSDEKENDFGVEFSDDIVQNIFSKNTDYVTLYKKEAELFYTASQNKTLDKKALQDAFETMQLRQSQFFTEKYKSLYRIDNMFLTMEGLGQYSIYIWMIHPKGGNTDREIAINGIRRNKKWWSQDEGLGLFLVLEKLSPPKSWAKKMFEKKAPDVVSLIKELNK